MRQQSFFNRTGGLALLFLAALSTPVMAQSTYSDTPSSGEQPYSQPGMDQQAPMERQPGTDSSTVSPDSTQMQSAEPEARGPQGPIRGDQMGGSTAADRGYEAFRRFQEERSNTP